jgi:hypothetical protein
MSLELVLFVPVQTSIKDLRARLTQGYALSPDENLGELEELNIRGSDDRLVCRIDYPSDPMLGILERKNVNASDLRAFFLRFCRWPDVNDVIVRIANAQSWIYTTTGRLIPGEEYLAHLRADPAWNPYSMTR